MTWMAEVDKWWNSQDQFVVRDIPAVGVRTDMFILRDRAGRFDINVFDSRADAREFAWQMVHGVLHREDQIKAEDNPTSFEIRKRLIQWQHELAQAVGLPDKTKRETDLLGMMFDMVQDALDKGLKDGCA